MMRHPYDFHKGLYLLPYKNSARTFLGGSFIGENNAFITLPHFL